MHRIRGEVSLLQEAPGDAERHFRTAVDLARARAEKSLELRTAIGLARVWRREGRDDRGRPLLASVYGWFTEGFSTADLREARRLLDTLA